MRMVLRRPFGMQKGFRMQKIRSSSSGVLAKAGGDGHRAHGEELASVMRDTKWERREEGKDECTCGRFADLVVEMPHFCINYVRHQHLTNLH